MQSSKPYSTNDKIELLIKDGRIVDGTGNPPFRSDIGVSGGRIVCIEKNITDKNISRVINAEGLIVSSGFIDTHSHDDACWLRGGI